MVSLEFLEKESVREFYFVAISLILAFGVLQTTGTALNTDQPVVSVVSCSMYPQLHVGDVLVVNGVDYDKIETGDIIVFSVQQVEISIDGQDYSLNGYSTANTSLGGARVLSIATSPSGQAVAATVEFDGERVQVVEGETYSVGGRTLEVGEVEGDSIPIVHRVIEKNGEFVQTKGDNNNRQLSFESRVEPEQIHGNVLFMVPRIGGVKLLAMDLIGYSGDAPLVLDSYPRCTVQNEYTPGQYRSTS